MASVPRVLPDPKGCSFTVDEYDFGHLRSVCMSVRLGRFRWRCGVQFVSTGDAHDAVLAAHSTALLRRRFWRHLGAA